MGELSQGRRDPGTTAGRPPAARGRGGGPDSPSDPGKDRPAGVSRGAGTDPAPFRSWPRRDRPGEESWRPATPSAEALAWAQQYACRYEEFLASRLVPSPDPEEYWTLHQFGWLFILAAGGREGPAGVREAVRRWIARLGDRSDDPSWRSFSIAERICNWGYFYLVLGSEALPEEAPLSLARQAEHLEAHLECYPDGSTNNHLIEDGRGLYAAGYLLGRDDLRESGREILLQGNAPAVYSGSDSSNEGSSHYHLIFTRAYLDALRIAAVSGDEPLSSALGVPVVAALRGCAYFRDPEAPPGWSIPLIGDVSRIPRRASSMGAPGFGGWPGMRPPAGRWTSPSPGSPRPRIRSPRSRRHPPGWSRFPASGHYRFNGSRYGIWWHSRRKGLHQCHAHNDWGSFQLHVGGDPVVVDSGARDLLGGERRPRWKADPRPERGPGGRPRAGPLPPARPVPPGVPRGRGRSAMGWKRGRRDDLLRDPRLPAAAPACDPRPDLRAPPRGGPGDRPASRAGGCGASSSPSTFTPMSGWRGTGRDSSWRRRGGAGWPSGLPPAGVRKRRPAGIPGRRGDTARTPTAAGSRRRRSWSDTRDWPLYL